MEARLDELLEELIAEIAQTPPLQPAELGKAMYPSDIILALHNHLGNIKQLIDSSVAVSNSADKFYAFKAAQKELDGLKDKISTTAYTGLITDKQYASLRNKTEELTTALHDSIDSDYQ